MAQLARRNVGDFITQVNAKTPGTVSGATYVGSLNSDGSVKITKNGAVLYANVFWGMQPGQAITDANISGDSVMIRQNDASIAPADCQSFLNTLT